MISLCVCSYDPELGRFISPDTLEYLDPDSVNGLNLYAYCNNNPVMFSDPGGHFFLTAFLIVGITLLTFAVAGEIGATYSIGKEKRIAESSGSFLGIFEREVGTGYRKSFDTGKPINFYYAQGETLFDVGIGIDMNFWGYGVNLEIGTNTSVGIHFGSYSVDVGIQLDGSLYIKGAKMDNGVYAYEKLSVNLLKIAAFVYALSNGTANSPNKVPA